jgi:PAT family beta-lactamase induction signal transducer AmpG
MAASPLLHEPGSEGTREGAFWQWIGTLYVAEGVPATVITTVAAILFQRLRVPNERIVLYASALTLPWIFRPLWGPFIERLPSKAAFVIGAQCFVACGLAGVACALATENRVMLCLSLFAAIALAAATHDMVADGLYVTLLAPDVQARYVGWIGAAFTTAKLTTQGLLVMLAGVLEPRLGVVGAWQVVFVMLAGLMGALAVRHVFALRGLRLAPALMRRPAQGVATSTIVAAFFRKRNFIAMAGLVLLYKATEGQLLRIVPLFVLDSRESGGLGFSTVQAGALYGLFPVCAYVLGALGSGRFVARRGLHRALLPLCIAANLPPLIYAAIAWGHPRAPLILGLAMVAEQVCYGVGSIGLKLVMMHVLAAGPFATAHLAFAIALSSLGANGAGVAAAFVQARFGYVGFFGWVVVAALPPMLLAQLCARYLRVPSSEAVKIDQGEAGTAP